MPENVIDQALEQVADRTPIDWDALESAVNSVDERRWLDCVKVLQDIARFHFSTDDVIDPLAPGSDTTGPGPAAGADTTDRAAWWGRYRLDQKVGEGAFGCVYRAWDPELEREVAVKVLHKRVSEARLKEGLLREGRALARVRHPNVVSVLSVESHEDQIALCMEFVHGETLADGLSRGPLSAREAALVCQDVCRALAAVHLAGFVHRDVKARNVMREKAGRIVLMDFGAGQHASQLDGIGRNRVVGTPLYMAPEILAGEPASATSDVYSAGVLLYHLVTSEYPVEGQTLDEIRAAHMQGRRRLLSERRPELPVTFLQVVDKALAADPGRRYGSAALFLEALVAVADEVKVEPRSKSSTLLRILSTVVAVLIAAVTVGFILSLEVNHAFGRSEFIAESPLDWLIWGLRSWIGTVITLLVIGLGASALLVVRQLTMSVSTRARELEATLVRSVKNAARRVRLNDPTIGVSIAVLLAAVSLIGGFWYFSPFLGALMSDFATAPPGALELLSPANRPYHELYRKTFTGIMMFSALVWYVTWRLARTRRDAMGAAICVGAGAVFLLSVIYLSLPFRVTYNNTYDMATWQDADCYVTGRRGDDILLFCPELQPSRNRTIQQGAPGFALVGRRENIFTRFRPAGPPP